MYLPGINGEIYSIIFVERLSRWAIIYFENNKMTITHILDAWYHEVEKLCGEDLMQVTLRMDNDPSTTKTKKVLQWAMQKHGKVNLENSANYTPGQIGDGERTWRSANEMTRSMLDYAKLSQMFFIQGMRHSIDILNRMGRAILQGRSSYGIIYEDYIFF